MRLHLRKTSLLNESLRLKKKKKDYEKQHEPRVSHFKDVSILDNFNWLLTPKDEEISRICFFFPDDSLSLFVR